MVQVLDKLVVLLPKDGLQQVAARRHELLPASSSESVPRALQVNRRQLIKIASQDDLHPAHGQLVSPDQARDFIQLSRAGSGAGGAAAGGGGA